MPKHLPCMEPALQSAASCLSSCHTGDSGYWAGDGQVKFTSGAVYDGQWSLGRMHGTGELKFPDGVKYQGNFLDNTPTGFGTYSWPGGATYIGEVSNGRRHGYGTLSFADSPVTYVGDWQEGQRHGKGKLTLNSQATSYYQGDWSCDMKHGIGEMSYESGDHYVGSWEADVKSGNGLMIWRARHQQYTGQWARNMPNGIGTHVWLTLATDVNSGTHATLLMPNRYIGHFHNGKRHGYGVLVYATGARYEGHWHADQKHGPGCYVFENGQVWRGQWAEDRPVLQDGQIFAPDNSTVVLKLDKGDLGEEDSPDGSMKALLNLLQCYNTELRGLYDKYCQRQSPHLSAERHPPNCTLTSAQFWELLRDSRILCAGLTLARVGQIVVAARQCAPDLTSFRQQECSQVALSSMTDAEHKFWEELLTEAEGAGPYSPTLELIFPVFCESLIRVASVRFAHVAGIERRLHLLLQHILPLAPKKTATPPPLTPFHKELTQNPAAIMAVQQVQPQLQQAFLDAARCCGTIHKLTTASNEQPEDLLSRLEITPRALIRWLHKHGRLPSSSTVTPGAAAAALLYNSLARNEFTASQRLRVDNIADNDSPDFEDSGWDVDERNMVEAQQLLDTQICFADWVEAAVRLAAVCHRSSAPGSLAEAVLGFWTEDKKEIVSNKENHHDLLPSTQTKCC